MPYEADDVIRVKIVQDFFGQEVLNVLHYNIVTFGLSADIQTLLAAIETTIVDFMLPLQVASLTCETIRIDNLTDTITFDELAVGNPGGLSPPASPSFMAAAYIKNVSTKSTRPGQFRLGGMTEATVNGNDWQPNATDQQNLADVLHANIDNGLTGDDEIEITPVIARLLTEGPPATYLTNSVTGAAARTLITTQNTRKEGRGT